MKQLACAALLSAGLMAYGDTVSADVAAVEAKLKNDIMTIVNQVNPIDSTTGQRKYISFGFISDVHKCKRVPGDDDPVSPVTDYWYGSAGILTEAEQSIRLLGSVATDAGLDAIINGGDLSTAPVVGPAKGLTEVEYTNEIWNVKAMFNQHIPSTVPLFTIDGNHERSYNIGGASMNMSDENWAYVLTNFNTSASAAHAQGVDITYHRDIPNASIGNSQKGTFTGNSYHLDFRRLYASKGYNVRIACLSAYDKASGSDLRNRVFDAGQFYDASGDQISAGMTPENTIMGLVAHGAEETVGVSARSAAGSLQCGYMNGYSNPGSKAGPWNGGTHKGLGFFGLVAAHYHFVTTKEITDAFDNLVNADNKVYASSISVSASHAVNYPAKPAQHELGKEAAYHFSIFVIDTDKNLMREVRLGGWTANPVVHENPVVQLHDTNLRTQLDKSGPVVGSLSVSPSITSATLSGSLNSVGSDATACDVYLSIDGGAAIKIASGVTGAFSYELTDLTAETTYSYTLTVSNNAATVKSATKTGSFTTQAAPKTEPDLGAMTAEVVNGTNVTVTISNLTLGTDDQGVAASSCSVYFAVKNKNGTEIKSSTVKTGLTASSYSFTIKDFAEDGNYTCEVTITTDKGKTATKSAAFTIATPVEPDPGPGPGPEPGEGLAPVAGDNASMIQAAIDAAAPEHGTVTLGEGTFEVQSQLMLTNGVTLVGQGMDKTVIKYVVAKAKTEVVVSLSGSSTLKDLTVTGGNNANGNNNTHGGGVSTNGDVGDTITISWCRITDNCNQRGFGGGIYVAGKGNVTIDHTIVSDNRAATNFSLTAYGGGIGIQSSDVSVTIDSCLVSGNTVGNGSNASQKGAGIGVKNAASVTIRNTTIAGNTVASATGTGGGIHSDKALSLVNCIVADNIVSTGDANVSFYTDAIKNTSATTSSNCVFGNGTAALGANSVSVASVGFVGTGDYHLAEGSAAIGAGSTYVGLANDLDDKAFAATPSIGCYEYGSVTPPAPEWDVPGTTGGIQAIDDGAGHKRINITSFAIVNGQLTLGFEAAKVDADGQTFALVCKENLTDAETFTLNVTLTNGEAANLGSLAGQTDKSQLFILGIESANTMITGN